MIDPFFNDTSPTAQRQHEDLERLRMEVETHKRRAAAREKERERLRMEVETLRKERDKARSDHRYALRMEAEMRSAVFEETARADAAEKRAAEAERLRVAQAKEYAKGREWYRAENDRLAEALREADESVALLISIVEHEREHGHTKRGMDTAMEMVKGTRQRHAALLADTPAPLTRAEMDAADRVAECKHGTEGAAADPSICSACMGEADTPAAAPPVDSPPDTD